MYSAVLLLYRVLRNIWVGPLNVFAVPPYTVKFARP